MIGLTQVLSDEHQNILKVIKAVRKECQKIKAGGALDHEFFTQAIDFIKNYADKFHHAKEEDILFKAMCQPDIAMHCNPIDQMLHEHDLGRGFIKNAVEALETDDSDRVVASILDYAYLLEDHIAKEDNILYPMAAEAIPLADQEKIKEEFFQVEQDRFLPEMKANYLKIVADFESR